MKDRWPLRVALKPRVHTKLAGVAGSGSKLIWRAPTTGRPLSCSVAANFTGSTSSTTTAPDGTPSRTTADRICAAVPRSTPIGVAAYNAGEDQAALWRRYCLTAEPEEFLAKIGFRETRAYVVRVLESQAAYRALYGGTP